MEILCQIFLTTDTKGKGREHVPSCCIARDGWRHYRSTAIPTFASPHQPVFAAISPFPSLSIQVSLYGNCNDRKSFQASESSGSFKTCQSIRASRDPTTRTGGSCSNSISYINCQPTPNLVVRSFTCTTDVTFPVKRRERNEFKEGK